MDTAHDVGEALLQRTEVERLDTQPLELGVVDRQRQPDRPEVAVHRARVVVPGDPFGQPLREVVRGGGDPARVVVVPEGAVRVVSTEHDRRAVLAADRPDLRVGVECFQPVSQRGDEQSLRRSHVLVVVHAVDLLAATARPPVVGDHPMGAGRRTGRQGRVAGTGIRQSMVVASVGEHYAFVDEATKTAGEERVETVEIVRAQLIDDHEQHEPRAVRGDRLGGRGLGAPTGARPRGSGRGAAPGESSSTTMSPFRRQAGASLESTAAGCRQPAPCTRTLPEPHVGGSAASPLPNTPRRSCGCGARPGSARRFRISTPPSYGTRGQGPG